MKTLRQEIEEIVASKVEYANDAEARAKLIRYVPLVQELRDLARGQRVEALLLQSALDRTQGEGGRE